MKFYITAHNIITSLGKTSAENWENIKSGKSGIKKLPVPGFSGEDWVLSIINNKEEEFARLNNSENYSTFESLLILSISEAISNKAFNISSENVKFIFSSTKGNVEKLKNKTIEEAANEVSLYNSAIKVCNYFNNDNTPIVISNACISGVVAIIDACLTLSENKSIEHVVVSGADLVTDFVYAGFQSFKSLSEEACKPYDKNRVGLSLGEGAGTLIVSRNPISEEDIEVIPGAVRNDANHISGPSRTGEGLYRAIKATLKNHKPDVIHAHGTATPYNDDMESIAIKRAGLSEIPLYSIKGYVGHTLGAAGIIESVISICSMKEGVIPSTLNCNEPGTVEPLNIITTPTHKEIISTLKIASGFGGCNAAILLNKQSNE